MFPFAAYAGCDPGETVVKFSHVVSSSGNPKGDAATLLEKRVNEEMDGRMCMEVFPNSQLYDDNKVLEALILGDVQLAAPSLSKLEKYTLKFRLFDLPFLFEDIQAVDRFQLSSDGQKLLESVKEKGLLGLGFWHNGMKQISANRPLMMPQDAKGLKFRIMSSDVLEAQIRALDAVPQKLSFKEVYGALQTGVVDGQENTWSNIYTKKFYEVQDGVTESNHGVLDYIVMTSSLFWDGLSEKDRKDFRRIFDEVTKKGNAAAYAINQENRQKVLDSGVKIRTFTPEERMMWVEQMKPVWAEFSDDIGEELIESALRANRG
jgi:C4-dicarboxylate-binding protein DctP